MATILRNPVPSAKIPEPVQCVDLGGGTRCQALRELHPFPKQGEKAEKFTCWNRRNGRAGQCNGRGFVYPRKWSTKMEAPGGGKVFHFHQGIDLFPEGQDKHPEILSVTSGTVVQIQRWNGEDSGYGNVVAIHTPDPSDGSGITYWYAHCKEILVSEGDIVSEQQPIALVGSSGKAGDPHLHFETLKGKVTRSVGGYSVERRIGQSDEDSALRLDPLGVLEALGPWGMQEVFDPWGNKLSTESVSSLHEAVESSPHGGYYPLGANNHWHGGVHLRRPVGTPLHAPFDATIVAARLDPDPTYAEPPDGHTNFILLRHEISPLYYELFQGANPATVDPTPPPVAKEKDRAVGTKSRCANDPPDVVTVKHKLHEHQTTPELEGEEPRPYYDPRDPKDPTKPNPGDLDDGSSNMKGLVEAIKLFQKQRVKSINPDGVVDIPNGGTWKALHGGTLPEEPPKPPLEPKAAPTVPPERVLYSLLMHLQPIAVDRELAEEFPWLGRVKLAKEPDPADPEPAPEDDEDLKRAEEEREEDLAEAEHVLEGAVGAPSGEGVLAQNVDDDVLWVHKRLIRFGYHDGPSSSTSDEALIAAIRSFQNERHPKFKKSGKGDGRVDVSGETVKLLRKTRAELTAGSGGSKKPKIEVDPVFVERTTERDEHGMAKVITGLDVRVSSGEALWRSGGAAGYVDDGRAVVMLDQIHWEIFSEHLLVTDWETSIEDPDDDIVANVPERLLEFIEDPSPELQRDGLLLVSEIRDLYTSGRGVSLRRTPCRFVSHWGLDPDKSATKLAEMGFEHEGLTERLRPFMWWDQAADALPSDRHVWHYNPIELLGQYAAYLDAMKPIEPGDPGTHPTLVVWVYYVDGRPIPDAKVQLLYGIEVRRAATTRADGSAWFHAVPVGDYGVRVDEPATAPREVNVMPMASEEDHNVLEIHTDVEGPPRKRGTIKVQVRKHTGTIAGSGIEVWLEHDQTGPVTNDYTDHGKLRFENIVYGPYTLYVDGAEPVQISLDHKERNAPTIKLAPPIVSLWMLCKIDGKPGAYQLMSVVNKKDGTQVASGLTDADGEARFDVPQGHYRAEVGAHQRSVSAHPDQDKPFTLHIKSEEGPVPEAAEGILAVTVTHEEGDEPAVATLVFVSDAAHGVHASNFPNADGIALFELPPGRYEVRADDETREVEVRAWDTTAVSIELDD